MHAPITALYAGLLGLLMLLLAFRVGAVWRATATGLGDGGHALLFSRIRIHGNAATYVPLALLLMLIFEISGGSPLWLHALGIALVVRRLAHAQGLEQSTGVSPGRFVGNMLTWSVTLIAALRDVLG